MKTNKTTLILILSVILLMIGAVWVLRPQSDPSVKPWMQATTSQNAALVYFSKSKGSDVVTEAVTRPWPSPPPTDDAQRVSYAVTELLKGPSETEQGNGYSSEIPQGTKLLSVTQAKDSIQINLSPEFTSGGGSNSMLQRLRQLSKTLVSASHKKPVYLKVDGQQVEVLGGEGLSVPQPLTKDPDITQ